MIRTAWEYLCWWLDPRLNVQRLTGTEWGENWRAWPHCCGQAGCWMHVTDAWCGCACRWCRLAKRLGKSST